MNLKVGDHQHAGNPHHHIAMTPTARDLGIHTGRVITPIATTTDHRKVMILDNNLVIPEVDPNTPTPTQGDTMSTVVPTLHTDMMILPANIGHHIIITATRLGIRAIWITTTPYLPDMILLHNKNVNQSTQKTSKGQLMRDQTFMDDHLTR